MAISLFLAHDSLISDSKGIRQMVGYFADGISPVGVVIFGVLKFVSPAIAYEPIFQTIINSLTQRVNVFGARINIVIFFILVLSGLFVLTYAVSGNSTDSER